MHRLAQQVIQAVSAWENVETYLHQFGGIEFRLGKIEIGHMHMGSGLVDVPFPRRVRVVLITEGEAETHHTLPESGWVTLRTRTDADISKATRLLRLSYLHKRYRGKGEAVHFRAAAAELGFSDAVIQSFQGVTREEAETE